MGVYGHRITAVELRLSNSRHVRPGEIAATLRNGRTGRLDVEELAANLGVPVKWRQLIPHLQGLTTNGQRVTINSGLSGPFQRYALAHELAHVLMHRGVMYQPRESVDEELSADRFARDLLVPTGLAELPKAHPGLLALALDVPLEVVVSQLAVQSGRSTILRASNGVICCSVCGFVARSPGCACFQFRADRRLADRLPAVA